MVTARKVTIPDEMVQPILAFMKYTVVGALHLNKLAAGSSHVAELRQPGESGSRKRKRIVLRLSEGLQAAKKRKFAISKVMESFREYSRNVIEKQVSILKSHVVVRQPTHKSVELVRKLSPSARMYLMSDCEFEPQEITLLEQASALLTD